MPELSRATVGYLTSECCRALPKKVSLLCIVNRTMAAQENEDLNVMNKDEILSSQKLTK